MSQFSDRSASHAPGAPGSTPVSAKPDAHLSESSTLGAKALKLNLSVSLPTKGSPESSKQSVQLKSKNPAPTADPTEAASANIDAEVVNTVTHYAKAATVHPLASSRENRELRQQRGNLDATKEARKQSVDQATKTQQLIEQEKVQQKSAGQQANAKEGAELAGKAVPNQKKEEGGIVQGRDSIAAKQLENSLQDLRTREIEQTKEEHSRSNSKQTSDSGLAQRNASREAERESLSMDLVRGRSEEKKPPQEQLLNLEQVKQELLIKEVERAKAILNRDVPLEKLKDGVRIESASAIIAEAKFAELRSPEARSSEIKAVEQLIRNQDAVRQSNAAAASNPEAEHEVDSDEDIFDSWSSRKDKKDKKSNKQKLTTKQARRTARKLTPLERRKLRMKREQARRMRKRSRRKNRLLTFK